MGGKYEPVLTTHIDKGHIYNHLIFNAASFSNQEYYHSNKHSYHEIRWASDRFFREHGLSVIVPGRDKGTSYIEHQAAQNGTSHKAKLKTAIDRLIPVSPSLEDLLVWLQQEEYEIKREERMSPLGRRTRSGSLGSKPWAPITWKKPLFPALPEGPNSVAGNPACSLFFYTTEKFLLFFRR